MTFYTRLQNTAQKLLKGKGQSLTLTKVTAGNSQVIKNKRK